MNITTLLLLGFIFGLGANVLDPRREGVVGPIVLGILGSLMGTIIGNMVLTNFGIASMPLQAFIIPSLGSVFLLMVARLFKDTKEDTVFKLRFPKEEKQAWS